MQTFLAGIKKSFAANPYKFAPFGLLGLIAVYFGYGYFAEHRKVDDEFVTCFSEASYAEIQNALIPGTIGRYNHLDADALHEKGILCQIECKKRGYCSPWAKPVR